MKITYRNDYICMTVWLTLCQLKYFLLDITEPLEGI